VYELTAVTKDYLRNDHRVEALQGVSLSIPDGEWLAVKGPTGQGKSTLLQLLGGLSRPSSGTVLLNGEDLSRLPDPRITRLRAETIGFVFQSFNLLPTLTAQENVEAALVPLKAGARQRRQRAVEALASVGLADRAGHLPSELSGGQQQRVAIARALVKEPRVLLADEPTGNLDEDTAREIIALLEARWREHGLTVVLVTHDNAIAQRAQRVAVMRKGRLTIAAGSPTPFPSHQGTAE
jgi:putative ABC transport system ATP-binding protein